MEISSKAIPDVLAFFPIFLVVYLIAYFHVFKNWNSKSRPEASSCLISLFHSTPALVMASLSLFSDKHRGFASANTPFQNMVLDYSIAYFVMDLIHYLIFYPDDVLFIGHHLATLFVFLTCRYLVVHGAFAILVLLIAAEVTSVFQNLWTLANARRSDVEFAAKVYAFLSPPFYTLYTIVRGFFGPYFVYRMGVFYLSGAADSAIPRWVWASWMVVVVVAISVSILWISNLWIELFQEGSGIIERKMSYGNQPNRSLQGDEDVVSNLVAKHPDANKGEREVAQGHNNVGENDTSPYGSIGWRLRSRRNGCLNLQYHIVCSRGKGYFTQRAEEAEHFPFCAVCPEAVVHIMLHSVGARGSPSNGSVTPRHDSSCQRCTRDGEFGKMREHKVD
ncbi:hypothetical protein Ancab_027002 [Ancistrocladus abbreviatus]